MQCVCYTHLYVDVLDEGSNESNDDFTLCDISQRVSSNKKISSSKRLTWHPRIFKPGHPEPKESVPRERALRASANQSRTPRRSNQSRPPRDSDRKAPMLYAAQHHAGLPANSAQTRPSSQRHTKRRRAPAPPDSAGGQRQPRAAAAPASRACAPVSFKKLTLPAKGHGG